MIAVWRNIYTHCCKYVQHNNGGGGVDKRNSPEIWGWEAGIGRLLAATVSGVGRRYRHGAGVGGSWRWTTATTEPIRAAGSASHLFASLYVVCVYI